MSLFDAPFGEFASFVSPRILSCKTHGFHGSPTKKSRHETPGGPSGNESSPQRPGVFLLETNCRLKGIFSGHFPKDLSVKCTPLEN